MSQGGRNDTIVLVHGLWMTPRCWENWITHYENKGFRVFAPAYPGFEVEVEALRADPTPIATANLEQTIDALSEFVDDLEAPPILMGHSFGGALTQVLLDRGLGSAGVVIDSAPPQGVRTTPLTQLRSLFPLLSHPSNRNKAAGFTPSQFHYAFTNTMPEKESNEVYDRYHIPAPGSWLFKNLPDNYLPGHALTHVNFANNKRSPLLFIGGEMDHIMPPAVNKSNMKKYARSTALTEYKEFQGRDHFTCGAPGWQQVADYALEWAVEHVDDRRGSNMP